jgi:hypothetical protein
MNISITFKVNRIQIFSIPICCRRDRGEVFLLCAISKSFRVGEKKCRVTPSQKKFRSGGGSFETVMQPTGEVLGPPSLTRPDLREQTAFNLVGSGYTFYTGR